MEKGKEDDFHVSGRRKLLKIIGSHPFAVMGKRENMKRKDRPALGESAGRVRNYAI